MVTHISSQPYRDITFQRSFNSHTYQIPSSTTISSFIDHTTYEFPHVILFYFPAPSFSFSFTITVTVTVFTPLTLSSPLFLFLFFFSRFSRVLDLCDEFFIDVFFVTIRTCVRSCIR